MIVKKNYYHSFIITGVDKSRMEADLNSCIQMTHAETKDILNESVNNGSVKSFIVFEPKLTFFKNNNGFKCLALIYGHQREYELLEHKKGINIHEQISKIITDWLSSLRGYFTSMGFQFKFYAYGYAEQWISDIDPDMTIDYEWTLLDLKIDIKPEDLYKIYPEEYITFHGLNEDMKQSEK